MGIHPPPVLPDQILPVNHAPGVAIQRMADKLQHPVFFGKQQSLDADTKNL
jgi:hypothetical protein